jgi:phosphonoacetaldehyde hydrolase
MWTVGVSLTGNEVGLSAADLARLPETERKAVAARVSDCLFAIGANYVVESAALIEPVLDEIKARLLAGERL